MPNETPTHGADRPGDSLLPGATPSRSMRRVAWLALVLVLALGALAAAVAFADREAIGRGLLVRALGAATGREVVLERLVLHLQRPLHLELHGLRIANPDWATERWLFAAERVDASIRLGSLLRERALVLPTLALTAPRIVLEQRDGRQSWSFAGSSDAQATDRPITLPEIGELSIRGGSLRWIDNASGTDVQVPLGKPAGSPGEPAGGREVK